MKLALLGKDISHSLSPALYKKIIGPNVNYDLIDCQQTSDIPTLKLLSSGYDGLNITAPYKTHFFNQVFVVDEVVRSLGSINLIALQSPGYSATNTDLLAVQEILQRTHMRFPRLHIMLLGDGVMAKLTQLVADNLSLKVTNFARKNYQNFDQLDLTEFEKVESQTLVINSCSREFVFRGKLPLKSIFWDYNYRFLPHQNTLPSLVKEYWDGQEMLFLQAQAAVVFLKNNNH